MQFQRIMIVWNFGPLTSLLWHDMTILSRQQEWREMLFHVEDTVEYGVSCHTNVCGMAMLLCYFVAPAGTARTKGLSNNTKYFLR